MTVEVATFISDLQPINPPSTDPRSQGDDHLRLLKQVLQNTFGGASRQWQVPGTKSISTSYSVLKSDGESIIFASTTGAAVTATLPALVAGDAGWKVRFVKTSSDANPLFVAPPSGTINSGGVASVAKARRCIPGVQSVAVWDGANWFITRVHALPLGSCVEFHGGALPAGFEWPNGQTLSSAANYPEYNAAMGSLATLDKRGRIGVTLDNLGGAAAGRLSGGFITGTAVGNVGGTDGVTLAAAQIPTITSNVSVSGTLTGTTTAHVVGLTTSTTGGGGFSFNPVASLTAGSVSVSGTLTGTGTSSNTGGGSHSNLQPSMMVGQVLVVE